MKKIYFASVMAASVLFFQTALAQQTLDYQGATVVDSDLDGLTDLGEERIFGTDRANPDSDGDGMLDGAEVIGKTNPLNGFEPQSQVVIRERTVQVEDETPWAWYVTRASGLIAFLLLFLDMFFGLAIRLPFFQRLISPRWSFSAHAFLAVQALFFALIHGFSQLFDKYTGFGWADILLPLVADKYTVPVAWGIIALYIMILLTVTSFGRKFLGNRLWRTAHYLNMVLFVATIVHALTLGTDMQSGAIRWIFIGMNVFLGVLIVWNIFHRMAVSLRLRRENLAISNSNQ